MCPSIPRCLLPTVTAYLMLIVLFLSDAVGETLRVSGLEVQFEETGADGATTVSPVEPVIAGLKFDTFDAKIELLRLDAGEAPEPGESKVDATQMLEDWDTQFVEGGPLVKVEVHERRTVSIGGNLVEVVYGKMRFKDRLGCFYGFTAAELAASKGASIDWNRYAFFVLCEAPEAHSEAVEELFSKAMSNLKVEW